MCYIYTMIDEWRSSEGFWSSFWVGAQDRFYCNAIVDCHNMTEILLKIAVKPYHTYYYWKNTTRKISVYRAVKLLYFIYGTTNFHVKCLLKFLDTLTPHLCWQGKFESFFFAFWFFSKWAFSKNSPRNTISVKQFGSRSGPTKWSGFKLFAKVISRRR